MRRGRLAGITAITITSLLWGTTGTAATFAPAAGPLAIGAAALGIGGLLQAAIAAGDLRAAAPALRARLPVIMLSAICVAIYPLAFYSSMHYAGVAIGSVVSLASAPLASGLLERVIERKPLSPWWMLAAGLGIIGAGMLCLSSLDDAALSPPATLAGVGLGLIAGVTYATYSWGAHHLMNRGIGRGASMGSIFGLGGALLMPVLALTGAPLLASREGFFVAAYMALIPMFLGYLLFGYGLMRVAASTATTITLIEPAAAALLAVLIVGERLTAIGWAGLVVVASSLLVLTLAPSRSAPTPARPAVAPTLPAPPP